MGKPPACGTFGRWETSSGKTNELAGADLRQLPNQGGAQIRRLTGGKTGPAYKQILWPVPQPGRIEKKIENQPALRINGQTKATSARGETQQKQTKNNGLSGRNVAGQKQSEKPQKLQQPAKAAVGHNDLAHKGRAKQRRI